MFLEVKILSKQASVSPLYEHCTAKNEYRD